MWLYFNIISETRLISLIQICFPAESFPESSSAKIWSIESLPGEKRLNFLPPQQYYIIILIPGKVQSH